MLLFLISSTLPIVVNFSSCSIDDDILNLIDEVDIEKELKEATEALLDEGRFQDYLRQKSTIAMTRFLVSFHLILTREACCQHTVLANFYRCWCLPILGLSP